MADKDKNKSGDFYTRPEKLGAWDGCKQFCWNPDTSQFMGRTSGSWGKFKAFFSSLPKKILTNKNPNVDTRLLAPVHTHPL